MQRIHFTAINLSLQNQIGQNLMCVCVCLSRCRAWLLLQMSSLRVKHQTAQTPSSKYHGTQILKVVITTRIIIIYNNPFALNQIIFSSWPKVVRIYVFNEPLYSWYSGMVLHFGCPTHQRWWTRIINFHHISLRIWHTKREAFYQDEKDHNFEVAATLLVKWQFSLVQTWFKLQTFW